MLTDLLTTSKTIIYKMVDNGYRITVKRMPNTSLATVFVLSSKMPPTGHSSMNLAPATRITGLNTNNQ